jgi:hypothetical protein
MATHYKDRPIEDHLAELARAEELFDQVDPDSLDHQMFVKLARGYAYIAVYRAKLTAMQKEIT